MIDISADSLISRLARSAAPDRKIGRKNQGFAAKRSIERRPKGPSGARLEPVWRPVGGGFGSAAPAARRVFARELRFLACSGIASE